MIKYLCTLCTTIIFFGSNLYSQGVWTQKANFGAGATTEARAFTIGGYGYFGGPTTNLWRYDPVMDVWTQMAMFIGPVRNSPVAFSIGTKGYLGTGNATNDFYEYDATTNTWTQLANFGGSNREGAVGIAIDGKGYVGTGGNYLNDWWEFDPALNAWAQKANLAGPGRYHAGAFSVGGKGFVCTGFNGSFFNDLWEYNPILNTWTGKSSLPGATRDRPVGLATNDRGYILTGWTGSVSLNDLWEYDPVADSWTALPSMPTLGRYNSCGFVIANTLYVGTGYMNATVNDFWEFGPDCTAQIQTQATTCFSYCDGTASVLTPDPAAIASYIWSNGQTTAQATNLCAGAYTVMVTDTAGCVSINSFIITEPSQVPFTTTQVLPSCAGDTNGVLCVIPGVNPYSLMWASGDTTSCISNISAGMYTVTITDSAGCNSANTITLMEPLQLAINFNVIHSSCLTCPDGGASAQITGGTPPLQYSWSTGSSLAFINNLLPGMYQFCVSDSNGCFECDSVEVLFTIGIEDQLLNDVTITPNPFNDVVSVSFLNQQSEDLELVMYDISGKEVLNQKMLNQNNVKINASALKPGVYFLKLSGENQTANIKLVKNR